MAIGGEAWENEGTYLYIVYTLAATHPRPKDHAEKPSRKRRKVEKTRKTKANMLITDSIGKYVALEGCETIPYRGYRIEDVRREIVRDRSMIEKIDNLIVHVGTNNIENQELNIIMSQYSSLIEVILNTNRSINLIMSAIIPRPIDHVNSKIKITGVNKELKKYTKEKGIKFTETDKIFRKGYDPIQELYAGDNLHLNFKGTQRLTKYFDEVFKHQ